MKTRKKPLQSGILSIRWQKMSDWCLKNFKYYPNTSGNDNYKNHNNDNDKDIKYILAHPWKVLA